MPRIAVLPPELASQIAAGEVVERPASAVKELVENALDAGATRVDVCIFGGGVTELTVSDDGHGMSRQDAELALERHATSKLRRLGDLERIASYGFRGEALPTIASVARLELTTRAAEDEAGTRVVVEGTGARSIESVGAPVGTRVRVRDLFFNVPARRKFLKSTNTEAGHVLDVLEGAALSRPDVTFTLERDGRRVREWLRAGTRAGRVAALIEDEELCACVGERGPVKIEAHLSRPERARNGAAGLRLLVNGRPVRDRALAASVAQAYGSALERGRYPRGVVYLDVEPALVDVNVHPQKAEVRFADGRATNDAVHALLGRALASRWSLAPARPARPLAPSFAAPHRGGDPRPPSASSASRTQGLRVSDSAHAAGRTDLDGLAAVGELQRAEDAHDPVSLLPPSLHPTGLTPSFAPPTVPARTERSLITIADALTPSLSDAAREPGGASPLRPNEDATWTSLRFVAQLRQTYLLCEAVDGIYVLDQHAAAERVAFDKLRKQYRARAVPAQSLLFPLVLDVSEAEAELVDRRADDLVAAGIELRVRGPQAISVHTVPRLLQRASPERLVRDLLSELSRAGERSFSAAVDQALATMACHGAIRAGDPLSRAEAEALLRALDEADHAGDCPHGRPVVAVTPWSELERKVGRR